MYNLYGWFFDSFVSSATWVTPLECVKTVWGVRGDICFKFPKTKKKETTSCFMFVGGFKREQVRDSQASGGCAVARE